jgi:CheY-like chemotaxis protein
LQVSAVEQPIDILLVEDNPNDAELAIRAMRMSGHAPSLLHVDDGVRALDFLFGSGEFSGRDTAVQPRVVLLDLKLPRVDGLEVLKRLRADERTRAIPVVVLSSSKEERDVAECYRHAVNSYVLKPVNFDAYSKAVAEVCRYWMEINLSPTQP